MRIRSRRMISSIRRYYSSSSCSLTTVSVLFLFLVLHLLQTTTTTTDPICIAASSSSSLVRRVSAFSSSAFVTTMSTRNSSRIGSSNINSNSNINDNSNSNSNTIETSRPPSIATSQQQAVSSSSTTTPTDTCTTITDKHSTTITETMVYRFGKFLIPPTSIFCTSTFGSAAFVNLRPLVPGHVLVMPQRIVPTLAALTEEEYTDLWLLVRRVQTVLQKAYPTTTAFNVAVQDGPAAGQSVPHVHVHILPRSNGSADVYNRDQRNDDIYQDLEVWSPRPASPAATTTTATTTPPPTNDDKNTATASLAVPDDVARVDRTQQMMDEEAHFYRQLLTTP